MLNEHFPVFSQFGQTIMVALNQMNCTPAQQHQIYYISGHLQFKWERDTHTQSRKNSSSQNWIVLIFIDWWFVCILFFWIFVRWCLVWLIRHHQCSSSSILEKHLSKMMICCFNWTDLCATVFNASDQCNKWMSEWVWCKCVDGLLKRQHQIANRCASTS